MTSPSAFTPTTLVIFGATGDLAKTKLYKALYSLYAHKLLPPKFKLIGYSRSDITSKEFQQLIRKSLQKGEDFIRHAEYQPGLFEDKNAYADLGKIFAKQDAEFETCSNKLFYLAVPPKYYKTIFENLAASGLTIPCVKGDSWTRVLVEKPFGEDAETANALDLLLSRLFREDQIFRIDHYLARETVQNILSFRFSNAIFEPVWNNEFIEHVEIKLLEKGGIGERGEFYDEIGALRDVGQNHLLQMLALIAMDRPDSFEGGAIRRERAKILDCLVSVQSKDTIRAQYMGYRSVLGVKKDSKTETYFRLKTEIQGARWSGVPFYLESGKGLRENRVEINIFFKAASPCFCPPVHEGHAHQNSLSFSIKPCEGITICFWTKKPGIIFDLEKKNFSFMYGGGGTPETREQAYEKVLFDCIQGEQMLFASSDEVAAAWRFIMPILRTWQKDIPPLLFYKKESKAEEIRSSKEEM